MEILCTRPSCSDPQNFFNELNSSSKIKTTPQRYCTTCGMPLILADRYLPEKLLGQGGFGAAFLARDRYSPKFRYCVVKQFKPSGNLSLQELEIARDLFTREGIVLEELGNKHPQIPELFAFFTPIVQSIDGNNNEQYFYLVQEYIDGRDLETELAQKGKFSEAEIIPIFREVLQILEFIHQKDVIHRDIKPSNIMGDRQGIIYLLDFGAVKQIASGTNPQELTSLKKSTGIYSMGFAPPEQIAGEEVYPATDLYALAVTCLSLLSGKPAEQLYDNYHHSWLWRNYVDISDLLGGIFDKMLMSLPSERFQSATEILSLLDPTPTEGESENLDSPTVTISPTSPPLAPPTGKNRFSLLEILGSAAFTGFEGALLTIALTSLISSPAISFGLLGATMAGLIFAQTRRAIEKIDLSIIAGITLAIVLLLPALQGELVLGSILIIAAMSGALAIATVALFRLVYQLLKRLL